jgi:hypothetical protein
LLTSLADVYENPSSMKCMPKTPAAPEVLKGKVAEGHLGLKSGQGFSPWIRRSSRDR